MSDLHHAVSPTFTVRAGEYEGPLELLLDLVDKRKLLVNEISLAQVTDDFIIQVRSTADFPISAAADFISVAATLLLIKSRSLLPDIELTQEEESDVEDLERRLALYAQVRTASAMLSSMFGKTPLYAAGDRVPEIFFAPGPNLTTNALCVALVTMLKNQEPPAALPEVRVRPLVSIEEMMDTLSERVSRAMSLSFREFTGDKHEKVEVIVSFLALLELVKQGTVEVLQHGAFTDIAISSLHASIPRY
jgi:segregation and condensation protein A